MNRWIRPVVPTGLVIWLVALFLKPYLAINPIPREPGLYGFLATALIFSLAIAWWPRFWPWFAGGLGLGFFGWLWALQPLGHRLSFAWLVDFVATLVRSVRNFFSVGGVDVPRIFGVALVMVMILFLAVVVIVYDRYLLAVAIVFAYLSAVHVFNGNNVASEFAQLAVATLLFAAWYRGGRWVNMGLTALIGLAVVAGAWGFVMDTGVNDRVADATVGLRSALNRRGFYQAISSYAHHNARTGFSENDATLGGPVYDDTQKVMTVRETGPHYMRVQVKTAYSGTGWTANPQSPAEGDLLNATRGPLNIRSRESRGLAKKGTKMTITNNAPESFLALPYGNLTISRVAPGSVNRTWYNFPTARLMTPRNQFKSATLTVTGRRTDARALRSVQPPNAADFSQDLQLPARLPKRVRNLARRLTRRSTTYYGKVKAIQNYLLTSPQLTYSKVDTPVTPRGRDYVDYFLFTSHVGYCDNFSTAMVVMLRSIGIPARWAKGFNAGSRTGSANGQSIYTITNTNAHSWPEVYFSGYGWLPFEPTPGFTNAAEPKAAARAQASASSSTSASTSTSQPSASTSSSASSASAPSRSKRTSAKSRQTRRVPWRIIIVAVIVLLILLVPVYPVLLATALGLGLTAANLGTRYRLLLGLLRQVARRQRGETLAVYAARVDRRLASERAFQQLTIAYEQQVYGGQVEAIQAAAWHQLTHAWRHSRFAWWHRPKA